MPEEIELTERELAIAKKAAEIAVKEITDGFYRDVGRTLVTRWLIVIGGLAVAWAAGKGVISFK